MSEVRFSHIGLCVADAERSLRFYTQALGFEEKARYEVGDEFAPEPVVEAVLAHGGKVHRETYFSNGLGGEFIYCTDPDGIRIELMNIPG
jgi:catechol 2,3-dioxygenase-like lactoylglutathione lyase family enzyme